MRDIQLRGFAAVPWESVFQRFLLEKHYDNKERKSPLFWMIRVLDSSFKDNFHFRFEQQGSTILFFSSFIGRKSVIDNLMKVRSLANSDLLIKEDKIAKISLSQGIRFVPLLVSWNNAIKKFGLCRSDRYSLLSEIVRLYRLHRTLELLPSTYRLIVTFYDSFLPESYAIEYYRLKFVESATLQHGQFTSWRADNFFDCGIEFKTFKSDYFLVWNQYTIDEAVKAGIPKEKLYLAGIWSYIGSKKMTCRKNNNGVFGVVISHPSWENENTVLIQAANMISSKYGFKYYLKLHPNYTEDFYKDQVNDHYIGNVKKGIPMIEYTNIVDFSLVGSSSVYTELVFIDHDVYRYSSGLPNDKYVLVKKGKFFTSVDDLAQKFDELYKMPVSSELFDYLCSVSDVTESYKRFFERYN